MILNYKVLYPCRIGKEGVMVNKSARQVEIITKNIPTDEVNGIKMKA
jgi:hypothetical protein